MNDRYLLSELFKKAAAARKAQREYYAFRGDPKTDPLKKSYLQEAQRREQDLGRLLVKLREIVPELSTDSAS